LRNSILLATILLTLILAGNAQKIYYAPGNEEWKAEIPEQPADMLYSVFLIGDLKYPLPENQNLQLLKRQLTDAGKQSAVVILGDILYPLGLPDSAGKGFKEADKNLRFILDLFEGYDGEIVFLPGNHDWSRGRKQGLQSLLNQESFTENYLDRGNLFLPHGGCPGPVEVPLTDDIVLVVFDSQWLFYKYDKPGGDGDCDFGDEKEIFIQIEDAIRRNRDKKVILASHHPLFSVGEHGGYFPSAYNLFPLLEFKSWLYFPLPGFIYTGYRRYLGHTQDLSHPDYKIFRATMMDILEEYPNVVYAAGHEHNLQYFQYDSLHHIVSGGGGEGTYISRKPKKTDFAFANPGFSRLSYYQNGNVWMEFISPDSVGNGSTYFTKKLFNKPVFDPRVYEETMEDIDFRDSTVSVSISDIYRRGRFMRFWMGDNYRNVWEAKVELPVFDIGSEKGGLTILKRGGGMQTRSIRMEDNNGKQYVLRSVEKYVEKALAENMQNTIAVDAVQDGISASHPFSAVTVPRLADAAGVMHTNPSYVWVPNDPRLGIYREEMANGVFLFEERPAGNRDDIESFRRSEKIVNTAKVIENTQKDHDYKVDQLSVVRARIFDMLINDWDRHDDQWRWASFKEKKKTTYQPIPRDRDQVYFINQGFIMWIATRKWVMPKFQGFDYEIENVQGLGFNARYFDRTFMTEPDREDWKRISEDIKSNVSDQVIHEAIATLPPNIYDSTGQQIEDILAARLEKLPAYASEYYRFLAKTVDVVGTSERELFDVLRKDNGNTEVTVYGLSKKKGKIGDQLYHREFKKEETKEIRLYGLKGKDSFKLNGRADKGIKIRVIGGRGKDSIIDRSEVLYGTKKTVVYDRKDKDNTIVKSGETRLRLSKNKSVNEYNRKQFKFNTTMPLLQVGYNFDDGILIGGGVNVKRYNFRDSTFHKITGQFAFRTFAFSIAYEGLVTSISKTFDLTIDAVTSFPRNVDNFYGLGNETENLGDIQYYRTRYQYTWINPSLKHTVSDNFNYSFGLFYQYFKVTDTADRFVGDAFPDMLDSAAYSSHHYTGLNFKCQLDTRDDEILPKRGILWDTELMGMYSVREDGKNLIKLSSDLRFFLSFRKDPRVVFAFRFGGAVNFGEYEFFLANFLGWRTNLRGFRSNRFAGDISFYNNIEIRFKLLNIKSYIFNGQTGFYIFNDLGRVWVKGENSTRWHDGYGIGVWLTPFDFTALTVAYNRSYEDSWITFSFRFLF
jgi:hypothetical protein